MAHLLPILQHHGLAAETSKQPPFTEVLAELDAYLADVKGLSDDSRRLTLRTIRLVLSAVMRGGRFDPARLTAPALQQHVADLAERRSAATDRSGDLSLPLQIGVLGLTHIFNCAVVYMGVALLARTVLRSRPGIARGVSCASGIAMIAIGVVLFAERLHS